MIASVIPSAKYPCSESPDRLASGRTAIPCRSTTLEQWSAGPIRRSGFVDGAPIVSGTGRGGEPPARPFPGDGRASRAIRRALQKARRRRGAGHRGQGRIELPRRLIPAIAGSRSSALAITALRSSGTSGLIGAGGRRTGVRDRQRQRHRGRLLIRPAARRHQEQQDAGAVDVAARRRAGRRTTARAPCRSASRDCRRTSDRPAPRPRVVSSVAGMAGLSLATPKSSTLIEPSRITWMLAGFRSRWMTPCACAAASADAS